MINFNRPGISPEYLSQNGIREVLQSDALNLCGADFRGIYIPYFDPIELPRKQVLDKDKPFGRLRKHYPGKTGKYHQEAGTVVHAYAPTEWEAKGGDTLAIVEGEFKSLALTDTSHDYVILALGIPGFFGFAKRKSPDSDEFELTDELAKAVEKFSPNRVLFLGDNDTVLNQQFAVAAQRIAELLPEIEVRVVQIPLNQPKGIDDCRASLQKKFENFFEELVDGSPVITSDTDPDTFSLSRLEEQIPIIVRLNVSERTVCTEKLFRFGAQVGDGARHELFSLVKKLGLGKTEFSKQVENKKKLLAREQQDGQEAKLIRKIQDFYCAGKSYLRKSPPGEFLELHHRADALLHLTQELNLSRAEAERALYLIQRDKRVDYAGPLAGFAPGVIKQNGTQILVTKGPTIIEPKLAHAPLIDGMLQEFFGKESGDPEWKIQYDIFRAFLARGLAAFKCPDVHLPGQALGFVGATDAGKNLIAEHLLTPIYGGRQADLSEYLLGGKFNGALLGAEHLIVSDSSVPADDDKRQIVRSRLKQLVANEFQPYHRKFGEQIDLRAIHRITILANPDRHGFSIFPELDASVRDKMIILKCYRPKGLPSDEHDRRKFVAQLSAELPAFICRIRLFKPDEAYADGRFGVGHYCHPNLAPRLNSKDPIKALSAMLVSQSMSGTAEECYQVLVQKLGDNFIELVCSPSELGRMLHQLMMYNHDWKDRIEKSKTLAENRNYKTKWILKGSS